MTAPSHDGGNLTPVSHHCLELDWSRGALLVTIGSRNKNDWGHGEMGVGGRCHQEALASNSLDSP